MPIKIDLKGKSIEGEEWLAQILLLVILLVIIIPTIIITIIIT